MLFPCLFEHMALFPRSHPRPGFCPSANHLSTAFDETNLIIYAGMHQVFSIWIVPFWAAHVSLTTVLHLVKVPPVSEKEKLKYLIQSQSDLYQVNEFFKFVSLFGILSFVILLWQFLATGLCVLGAVVFWPVTWFEENVVGGNRERGLKEIVGN